MSSHVLPEHWWDGDYLPPFHMQDVNLKAWGQVLGPRASPAKEFTLIP